MCRCDDYDDESTRAMPQWEEASRLGDEGVGLGFFAIFHARMILS